MGSQSRTWLITGGCGFIGINLIARILADDPGAGIRVLDNLSVGSRKDLAEVTDFTEVSKADGAPSGVELLVEDIRDYDACLAACQGLDTVVHLAANTGVGPSVEDPRGDMEANVAGTFNVLEAARHTGAGKFIFASSGAPVGEVEPPITEEKAPRPVSPYGASKLAGEGYCSAFYRTFGLRTIALRFGNVYGPRSKHKASVVAKFFKQALNGETLEIYGDGTQTRDFIYIDDLVNAIMLSVASDLGGEVFQIATSRETTVNEIAEAIKDIVEEGTGREVTVVHGATRLGDVKRNYSDISKARKMLGYSTRFELADGLRECFEYFTARQRA